jgi:hypothetical protein
MTLRHTPFVSGAAGGVATPQDARLAFAGLVTGPGILSGGGVTGSTSGPNMKYAVAAGSFVTARGTVAADGVYPFGNDGPVTIDSGAPAPSSGTRWDLVWVRHRNAFDGGFGDANSDPEFGVLVGVAGSSPVKPYGAGQGVGGTSLPGGALVLAESLVGTNIANASLATISQVAATPVARGGVQPVVSSATYPASPRDGEVIYDRSLDTVFVWNSGTSTWDRVGGNDTGWLTLPVGASFDGTSTAQMRLKDGTVRMRKFVTWDSGASFPVNGTTTIIGVGGLPAAFRPTSETNITVAGPTADSTARCKIPNDGSLVIVTGASAGVYVDLTSVRYDVDG